MITCSSTKIRTWLETILIQVGTPPYVATKVAESLIINELAEYKSHGVMRMLQYVKDIEAGSLNVSAKPTCTLESEQILHINGQRAFGVLVIELLIEQLRKIGQQNAITAVRVTNSHHIGRLYPIGLHLAEEPYGLFVLGFCNYLGNGARVAPPGLHRNAQLCTNPMLFSFPVKESAPFVLDMSTSTAAEGGVAYAHICGEALPEGILIDHEGRNTSNPHDLYTKPPTATLSSLGYPYGSHKGYGLAVFVEALVGILAGAGNILSPSSQVGNGLFVLTLNPSRFNLQGDPGELAADMMRRCYKSIDNAEPIRYPGLKSYACSQVTKDKKLIIHEQIYKKLEQLSENPFNMK